MMRTTRNHFLILILMSIIGLISSFTVIYEFYIYHNAPPFCIEQGMKIAGVPVNCEKVLLAPNGQFIGVPFDFLAALWFIINISLVILVVFAKEKVAKFSFRSLFLWRFLGILLVPYLLYLEFFVVKAICIYCTIMHGAIVVDFIIISVMMFSKKSDIHQSLFGNEGVKKILKI
ncbi:MAG: vitamin K epoxide reductase family protein [Candidatus Micrarchaeia archaeon]